MKRTSTAVLSLMAGAVLFASGVMAQAPAPVPTGPVPPAILSAKNIFVSNAGADADLFLSQFSGAPERGYNQFYAGLKASGQWDLVKDPAQADLVLELRLTAPFASRYSPLSPLTEFRLVVYDAKTHFVLWALTEAIYPANRQKTLDRNFDDTVHALLDDFGRLAGKLPPATR